MVERLPKPGAAAAKPLRLKAARLEREGDFAGALEAYEQAAALSPHDPELLSALARLAGDLELHDQAVLLWGRLMTVAPDAAAPALGCARALVHAARFPEAIELLKSTLGLHPQEPRLWDALGVALTYAGRAAEALTFFDEALRLDPRLASARYNHGLALCDLDRPEEAEADFQAASRLAHKPSERAVITFSLATLALARGDLATGWTLYEQRLSPDWPKSVAFQAPGRRLAQGDALTGRSLLVLAEQGIGDEILFANTLPDLIEELGPEGRLTVAVDPRLVDLFQRSFPTARVCPHATDRAGRRRRRRAAGEPAEPIEAWTPLASLARRYRRTVADFPHAPYLTPAPARVRHWRDWLGARPAVGVTWRSGKAVGERRRFYPDLTDWAGLLRTPGAQFVNLQYGDCEEDLAALEQLGGTEIRRPPGLNIKDDIDDLAALCMALHGAVCVQNATGALAGACGAQVAFIGGPGSWTQLGAERTPWYADARLCAASRFGDWGSAMAQAAQSVRRMIGA